MNDCQPQLCARCLKIVTEGRGEFFEVTIEAVADPSPPVLDPLPDTDAMTAMESQHELDEAFADMSAQEAQDQVYRRLQLILCNRCLAVWIEDPVRGHEE